MQSEGSDLYLNTIEQLFRIHYKSLKMYAFRFLHNDDAAEDIVQDVFLEFWQKQHLIRFDKNVKSYLFKSVYNRSINYLNSMSHKSKTLIAPNELLENYLHQTQNTQEDNLINKEIHKEIGIAVNNLPPQCKKVFLLSRTYELKNKEIAEQLDISVKSVEKHISKAIAQIYTYLKQAGILILLYLIS